MLTVDILLVACLAYVAMLFGVAFLVDRRTQRRPIRWLQSPVVYTLSISVYCTSWTFYGAVGSAARNGLEFITIYLGPTLVFVGWWWMLRKLVRIGRAHRITSIADLISSRYGKSSSLAVIVTIIAVTATTPYIALQLQSVTLSYHIIAGGVIDKSTAIWVAAGMALFTILFGTRNLDANERHHGVVAAIALEAIVKLVALIAVGVFATFWVADGFADVFKDVPTEALEGANGIFGPRWATLMFLSATAVICLPRQFQVTVVENIDERHLSTASWLFPLYLFGMSLFVLPIALVGLDVMPSGSNPDLYVLTLPIAQNRDELALLAFLGGFSSATSMVIVAAIAVSTMVSNHIVMPILMRVLAGSRAVSGDVRKLLLNSRRISIAAILGLGYLYFRATGGSDALAAIGLIAFVGVAQFLPSLLGALFWRGGTKLGAICGLIAGSVLWAYTIFLPSFGGEFLISQDTLIHGPWGIAALNPRALLGLSGLDPLVHAVVWSIGVNSLVYLVVSSITRPNALESLQASLFVNVFRASGGAPSSYAVESASSEDLFVLAQRILGEGPARRLFDELAHDQGIEDSLPHPTDTVIARLERELSGSIGAASAHAMVTRVAERQTVGLTELIDIADETQQLIETTRALGEKSTELERAATQLREANERLRAVDIKKDDFLSQVSHELRTPMTSIRSMSEILRDSGDIKPSDTHRFVGIIHEESCRLTRLLDELLDMNRLESGAAEMTEEVLDVNQAIDAALTSVLGMTENAGTKVNIQSAKPGTAIIGAPDRVRQVLINILSNAVKYNTAEDPVITVSTRSSIYAVSVDISDNGGGVSAADAKIVFDKFSRGERANRGSGAGLGLPISRAMMRAMKGDLGIEFRSDGSSFFRIRFARPKLASSPPSAEAV